VIVGAPSGRIFRGMLAGFASGGKVAMVLAKGDPIDRAALVEMLDAGRIKPVIERRYRLEDVPDAIRCIEEGHTRGKMVIDLAGQG
jgi:D-arabinose 1-dehydrogenase-like Zn-dependent alcohol dehydrogenase